MKLPVKLQRDAEGQFVCIPAEFELPGEDVIIRKAGYKLIIEPAPQKRPLLELLDELEPLEEDFPEIEELPPESS